MSTNRSALLLLRLFLAIALVVSLIPISVLPAYAAEDSSATSTMLEVEEAQLPELTDYLNENINDTLVSEQEPTLLQHLAALFTGDMSKYKNSGHTLYAKYTMFDAAYVETGDTIDDVFEKDTWMESLLGQYDVSVDLLDPSEDSDYYIALTDMGHIKGEITSSDVVFTEMNNDGIIVEGPLFDAETGIVYVPKSLYKNEAGDEVAFALQSQYMLRVDMESDIKTTYDVYVDSHNGEVTPVKSANHEAPIFDIDMAFPIVEAENADAISLMDIEVCLNGQDDPIELIEGTNASYDSETGYLHLFFAPINVFSVDVDIKANSNGLFVEQAHAATSSESLAYVPDVVFDSLNVDTIQVGSGFYFETTCDYWWPSSTGTDHKTYEICINSGPYCYSWQSDPDSLYEYMAWTNGADWNGVSQKDVTNFPGITEGDSEAQRHYFNYTIALGNWMVDTGGQNWHSERWPIMSSYDNGTYGVALGLQCSHTSKPIGNLSHQGDPGSVAWCRVLDLNTEAERPYILLGFCGPGIANQPGVGVYKFEIECNGEIQARKVSADPEKTEGNDCYDLAGAVYGVYADKACTDLKGTITTDSQGNFSSISLPKGIYSIKEIIPPKGYALDDTVYPITITAGDVSEIVFEDIPQSDPIVALVGKIDKETNMNRPQGSASLAGAEYTVKYYKGLYDTVEAAEVSGTLDRTWVLRTNENGVVRFTDSYKVSGPEFYYNSNHYPTIPLGTIVIQETKAPEGYFLKSEPMLRQVVPEGTMESVETYNQPIHPEPVFRGDFSFTKKRETSQDRLGGVPFMVTSNSTGEQHVVVTDANGMVNTSAAWNNRDKNTNGNDAAVTKGEDGNWVVDESKLDPYAGIWFYGSNDAAVQNANKPHSDGCDASVHDLCCALPFDTYTLEEIPCTKNEGVKMAKVEITIDRDSVNVDYGTIDDQPILPIQLNTVARDGASGNKYSVVDPETKLIDRVYYQDIDLDLETSYTLEATLMDRTTGESVKDANGDAVTGKTVFTPEETFGYVEIELEFDSRDYADQDVVFFERLIRDDKGEVVSTHEDLDDYDQTIHIVNASIATTATDTLDSDKIVSADIAAGITDKVVYRGLIPGETYTMTGTLMVKSVESGDDGDIVSATELLDGEGNPCVVSVEFVPLDENGEVYIDFTFDASTLAGKEIVVYETLSRNGQKITDHEDPNDEDQTVRIANMEISTYLAGNNRDAKRVVADSEAVFTDTIKYNNAVIGKTYEVYGILINNETAEPMRIYSDDELISKDQFLNMSDEELEAYRIERAKKTSPENIEFILNVLSGLGVDTDSVSGKEDLLNLYSSINEYPYVRGDFENTAKSNASKYAITHSTFCADACDGSVDVTYAIDARDHANETVTAFACVVDSDNNLVIAGETDINCEDQQISFVGPKIGTSAYDKTDGDKTLYNSTTATIADKVTYEGLTPGKEYILEGILYDKTTDKILKINDVTIESSTSFVPAAEKGSTTVEFTFDASELEGHEIVVFEYLYRDMDTGDGADKVIVAKHEDKNSADQTVKIKGEPKGSAYDKTGDEMSKFIVLLALLAFLAVGSTVYGIYGMRRQTSVGSSSDVDASDKEA